VNAVSVTPPAKCLWMTPRWPRMNPGGAAARVGAVRTKIHQWPPKADYRPVRQFDSLGYSLRHLCRDVAPRCTRWRSRA
jgi:hypothetical protein